MYKGHLHLSLVAAMGKSSEIGKDNKLLWRIPLDLRFYKSITWGMVTVMGRYTYQSILNSKGLPPSGRQYVVISHSLKEVKDTLTTSVFPSLEQGLDYCIDGLFCRQVIIAGGAKIYEQSLEWADAMILTQIEHSFQGADTFFPYFQKKDWKLVRSQSIQEPALVEYPLAFNYYHRQ